MSVVSVVRYAVNCHDCEFLPRILCHSMSVAEKIAEEHLKFFGNPLGDNPHTVEITEKTVVMLVPKKT